VAIAGYDAEGLTCGAEKFPSRGAWISLSRTGKRSNGDPASGRQKFARKKVNRQVTFLRCLLSRFHVSELLLGPGEKNDPLSKRVTRWSHPKVFLTA